MAKRIRLTQDEPPCLEGWEGEIIDDSFSDGLVKVRCDRDHNCNVLDPPFTCHTKHYKEPKC